MENTQLKKKMVFSFFFTLLGLLSLQIPFTHILGANVKFTLFDFFAPSVGVFLGLGLGVFSVFSIQIINIILHGISFTNPATILRLFPTLFAVSYFSRKRPVNLFIPLLAIIAFNLHPIGKSAWQYSFFWLVPIFTHFLRKNLFLRSLGTTFIAHSVGSICWLYAFNLSKETWLSLISQTAMERVLFACGITIFYLVVTNAFNLISKKLPLFHLIKLEKQYLLT